MLKRYIGRLGKNSVIYGVGNSLSKVLALLLLPFLTAYLTPEDYGIISMFATFATFIQPIFQMGISAGLAPVYFSQDNNSDKNMTIFNAFFLLLISSCLLTVLSFLCREKLSYAVLELNGYGDLFFIYMLSIAVSSVEVPLLCKYQFDEKAMRFVIVTVLSSIFNYGLLLFLVIALMKGLSGYIYGALIGEVVRFFLFGVGLNIKGKKIVLKIESIRKLLRVSLPFVPSFFSIYLLQQIGRIILQRKYGLEAVGVYSVGVNLGSVITVLTGAVTTAWVPFFLSFRNRDEKTSKALGTIITFYVYIMGTIVMMFFVFSKPVVETFVDNAYYNAYQVIGLYACAQFFSGLFSMLLPPIYYAAETKYVSVLQTVAAVISIILTELLTKGYGMLGAGISIAISYFILVILVLCWNCYKKDYFKIMYEWRRCIGFFLLFLVGILITFYIHKGNLSLFWEWIRAIFVALIWLCGIGCFIIKTGLLKNILKE